MHSTRRSLWIMSSFLLATVMVACSPTVPSESNLASASTAVPGLRMSPVPSSAALATAPAPALAVPTAASSTLAARPGWHQIGRLAAGSANGPTIATLAINPSAPTTRYAGTLYTANNHIGVYRSGDAGATWQPAGQGLPITTDGTGVEGLTIDPQHPATLYASGHFDGIWRSDDRGESWHATGPKGGSVGALALDPRASGTLYALTGDGPQRSTDGGTTWRLSGAGLPDRTSVAFVALLIDPQQPDTLYIGASFGGVFRSADAGEHWSAVNTGLPDQPVIEGMALDPQHSGTLYVSITGAGLYRSTDGGAHWGQVSDQEYLSVTPAADNTLYAMLDGALARSTDQGETWHTVADVACGVQSLVAPPSGGVMVGCLDGRMYALQATQPSAPPAAASATQPPLAAPPAAPAVPAPTPAPILGAADAKTAVLNAARALIHAGPYHVATTITSANAIIQITRDFVPPDRVHYAISTPDGTEESITIGKRSYTKVKGMWIADPPNIVNTPRNTEPFREAALQTATDVTRIGSDTVNGVAAQVYTYIFRAADQSSSSKVWINSTNGLPIKIETDNLLGGSPAHGTETMTYDPTITVNSPIS